MKLATVNGKGSRWMKDHRRKLDAALDVYCAAIKAGRPHKLIAMKFANVLTVLDELDPWGERAENEKRLTNETKSGSAL